MNDHPESWSSPEEPQPESSLPVRLANIYAAPGDVFDELRSRSPVVANWLVPVLLAAFVGALSVWVMFSQPAILQQMEEAQAKRYQELVEKGTMTQEQVDQAQQKMGGITMMIARIAGIVGAVVGSFGWLFVLALVFFLLMRGLHAPISYHKTVEIVGLSLMIGVLGGLVTTLLMVITGSMFANLGPSLFISHFDAANKTHLLASSLNLFTLWWLGVVAMGLARVGQAAFSKTALILYGSWALLRAIIIFSGLGSTGM